MNPTTSLDEAPANARTAVPPVPSSDAGGPGIGPPSHPPRTGGSDDGSPAGTYLRALRRWWWLPLVTGLLCAGTALALASRESPRYVATATAVVAPTAEIEESPEVLRSLDTLERRTVVATFARIASTREAHTAAADRLGLAPADASEYGIAASVISSTNLIRIRAEGPDPDRTADLANSATQVTEAEARRLYRIFTLHTVEAATPPLEPVHPDPQRNAGVGLVLGLFVGVLAALGIEAWGGIAREHRSVAAA